jgi:hypothetical protein
MGNSAFFADLSRRAPMIDRRLKIEALERRLLLAADFGDAPEPYPTLLADNGARHEAVGPMLGATRASEADGLPALDADGDGSDDGVTFGTLRVGQLGASVVVNVQNAPAGAKLDAWIDFNGDGNWGGPGEQILANAVVTNGLNVLTFDVPGSTFSGVTYARVRISSIGSLSYVGAALDGEVEDYEVTIVPPAPSLGRYVAHDIATSESDYTRSAYPADIDNDGDMDIIGTSRDGLVWHENMGAGSFTAHLMSTSEDAPRYVQVMDFDRDGDLDILTIEADPDPQWSGNWIAIHENLGSGDFDVRGLVRIYSQQWMSAQDVDLDGDTDLLINNGYYENQDGTFDLRRLNYVDAEMHHAVDVDRDGDLDLVSTELDDGGFGWQENNGGMYFTRHHVSRDAYWVSAGDIDRDGDFDLIAARQLGEGLAWYENDGNYGFTTHEIAPWPYGNGYRFTMSDIEGDGDLDLVALGDEYDGLWVYRNDGDGVFTEEVLMPTIEQVQALATADMDGDGDLDIISGQFSRGEVWGNLTWYENVNSAVTVEHLGGVIDENSSDPGRVVFRRTGAVNEGLTINFALAGTATYLQDYLLTGIAAFAGNAGTIYFPAGIDAVEVTVTAIADNWLESNETVQISLLSGRDYLIDSQLASIVHIVDDEAGDFGDAPEHYPTTLIKDGARHAAYGPMLGANRDSESNGQPTDQSNGDNLLASGEDGIQFGSLQVGEFGGSVTVTLSGRSTARLDAWIDFDGDGSWSGAQEQIAVSQLVQSGANVITFDVPSDAKSGVTHARFRVSIGGGLGPIGAAPDGEVEDVAVTIRPPRATIPVFEGTAILNYTSALSRVTTADLDGDGDLDALAAIENAGDIYWYENLGPQLFERHVVYLDAYEPSRLITADIDGDGDVDILAPGYHSIEWYRNNGAGSFSRTWISTGFILNSVEAIDLDADGDLDLLAAGDPTALGGGLAWYENDRNFFEYHLIDSVSASLPVTADFDYDGDLDIVAGIGGINQTLKLYRNDGSEQFAAATLEPEISNYGSLLATDLNRDGLEDVLFVRERNNTYEFGWLQNDGTGDFQKRILVESSRYHGTPAIADIDGDGDQDLLVPVYASNRLLLFANHGDGNFIQSAIDLGATGVVSVTAGDFDGDGDLDLLTGRATSTPMVYYENQNLFASGDFDGDGDVDGRDFLAWQRGASPKPLAGNDLADWQSTYGYTAPEPLAVVTEDAALVSPIAAKAAIDEALAEAAVAPTRSAVLVLPVATVQQSRQKVLAERPVVYHSHDQVFAELGMPSRTFVRDFGDIVTRRDIRPRALLAASDWDE